MADFEKVKKIIVDSLGVDAAKVTPEAKFIEDLGADSLATVELLMEFEKQFGVEIPDNEAQNIKTVQDVMTYIDSKVK
jgi:acyl carrier protein